MLNRTVTMNRHIAMRLATTALGSALLFAGGNALAQSSPSPDETASAAPTSSEAPADLAIDTPLETLRAQTVVTTMVGTEGSPIRTGYAASIIHRPMAQIVAAIHDVNHYRDFIPAFEQSQELGHGAGFQDLFVRIEIRHFAHIWARLRYRDATQPNGAIEIEGHAMQGNVARMDVRWRATPIENGTATVLEFWSLVLPQIPIPLPTAMIEHEQESAAQRGVSAVRTRVEAEEVRVSAVTPTAAPSAVTH